MKLALYARVSTPGQEKEETIETQILAIYDFAKKAGHEIVQEYRDDGWSGAVIVRPSMDELRMDAKSHTRIWEGIIVYDPDRIARKYAYQSLVLQELESLRIPVLFVTTPPPKTMEDQLMYGVKGLFAEYERAKIAERFRIGKLRKVREGHILLSESPYGYDYVKKSERAQGYLVINEQEAEVVKKIFTLVSEGMSIRAVVKYLKDNGIKPRKNASGTWNKSTLGTLLRRETYIGTAHYYRTFAVEPDRPLKEEKYKRIKKTSRRLRSRNDWVNIEVPQIIDIELFNKVQERLKLNAKFAKRNQRYDYLLSGLVECTCGRPRTGESAQQGKYLFYRCTDRIYRHPLPRICLQKGVNASVADQMVWDRMRELLTSPDLIKAQAERWLGKKTEQVVTNSGQLKRLEIELSKIRKEEQRYLRAYGVEGLSLEQLKDLIDDVKLRKAAIESQIRNTQETVVQASSKDFTLQDIDLFVQKVKEYLENPSFSIKRKLIERSIDKIVATQEELHVTGYIPLGMNKGNIEYESLHRHRRTPKRRQIHII